MAEGNSIYKTIDQIKTECEQIKNETSAKANSATRVGGAMLDIINHVEQQIDGKIDDKLDEFEETFETNEAARDALVDAKVGSITDLQEDLESLSIISDISTCDYQLGNYYVTSSNILPSASWKSWGFKVGCAKKVKAHCWSNSTSIYAISFFSSTAFDINSIISGLPTINGESDYEAEIPEGCAMVVVSSRIASSTNQSAKILSGETFKSVDEKIAKNASDIDYINAISDLSSCIDLGNKYIKNGVITPSSSWKSWGFYTDDNTNKIIAHLFCNETKQASAISFFSSRTFASINLMDGTIFLSNGESDYEATIPEGCKMVVVSSRIASSTNQSAVLYGKNSFKDVNAEIKDIKSKLDNTENYDSVGRAEFWLDSVSASSDMTWVGDRLVCFQPQSGTSQDYNAETEADMYIYTFPNGVKQTRGTKYTLKHKFGHCNTVDYCEENDCLILGNGSGSYTLTGDIIVIPNFSDIVNVTESSTEVLTLESVNAMVIHCNQELGTKFNLVWGDDNDIEYNIAYLITANYGGSTSANGGDLELIRKIVLRKGSEIGEYGEPSTNSTPFNGTFDIVESYTQTTEGYDNCDQGTCYFNGELFAAIGHSGMWIWRMRLDKEKVVRKNYKQSSYTSNGKKNVSGICYKEGYLYVGRTGLGVMAVRV